MKSNAQSSITKGRIKPNKNSWQLRWHLFDEQFSDNFALAEPPAQSGRGEKSQNFAVCVTATAARFQVHKYSSLFNKMQNAPQPPTSPSNRESWMNSDSSRAEAEFFPLMNPSSKTYWRLTSSNIANSIDFWVWTKGLVHQLSNGTVFVDCKVLLVLDPPPVTGHWGDGAWASHCGFFHVL